MNVRRLEGRLQGRGQRFAIVASRFNSRIVDRLIEGAVACLERHGVERDDLLVIRVPGAWEIPLALEVLAEVGDHEGLVALGAVIRGETPHFDYVCSECSSGVSRVSSRYRLPIGFGVLTCETSQQAEERSGGKLGNKGWEAAEAALEMVDLCGQLRQDEASDR